jgi:type I restriction enzyme, S subunit
MMKSKRILKVLDLRCNMKSKIEFKKTDIGKLPKKWDVDILGNHVKLIKGISYRSKDYCSKDEGFIFINLKCVARNGGFRKDGIKFYNGEVKEKQFVNTGDLLIANTDLTQNREIIGSPLKIPDLEKNQKMCISLDLSKLEIISDSIDSDYLYYYLKSPHARHFMVSNSNGTTVIHLTTKNVPNMIIPLPDIDEQKSIAKILSDLDSKIENNEKNRVLLEQFIDILFKHWFVDFEFPNENGNPFKSNGGKMKSSKRGDVPEMWNIDVFETIVKAQRGFSYTGKEKDKMSGDYVFLTLNNIAENGGFKPKFSWLTSDRLKERHYISEMDLIIANTHFGVGGANIARLLGCPALVFFPHNYHKNTGVFSHHVTKIIPFNPRMKYFLYFFLKQIHTEMASAYRTGTSVAGLDTNNFMKKCFAIKPSDEVLEKFNFIVEPIFAKLALIFKENISLSSIRDSLLPKIVTGKIEIPMMVK